MIGRTPTTEPVVYADVTRTVLTALVAVGWITIPSAAINTAATGAGFVLSVALTWWERRRVTPVVPGQPVVAAAPADQAAGPITPTSP